MPYKIAINSLCNQALGDTGYLGNSEIAKIMEGLKQAKNKDQLTKSISDLFDFQGATCTISEQTFDRHFTKISKNKWLYNPGPVGLCNVVRIATLENTPEFPRLRPPDVDRKKPDTIF